MSINVIDTIKPKNGGSFPVVDAADVAVSSGTRLDDALTAKANVSDLAAANAQIANKANLSDISLLRASIELKANQSSLDATNVVVASKANQSSLDAVTVMLDRKADKKDYDEIFAQIATKANTDDVDAAVDSLQTQIDQIEITASAEAVVAPEVIAARVDATSEAHQTLKERCDSDYNSLNDTLTSILLDDSRNCNLHNENDPRIVSDTYYDDQGAVSASGYYVSEPILIAGNVQYKATKISDTGTNNSYAIVESDGTLIEIVEATLSNGYLIIEADKSCYVSLNLGKKTQKLIFAPASEVENAVPFFDISTVKAEVDELSANVKNAAKYHQSDNLTDFSAMSEGYFQGQQFVENSRYLSSDFIPVDPTKSYTKYCMQSAVGSSSSALNCYAADKTFISTITGESVNQNFFHYSNIPSNCKYVRYTHGYKSGASPTSVYFGEGVEEPSAPFEPSAKYLQDDITVKPSQIYSEGTEIGNNLSGKVWYAIGDSATHGDFTGIVQPTLSDGKYAGELPVYPFFIGNRTGMVVHNLAVNGAVIATIGDQPTRYQFSIDGVYDTIVGADADYITIWLGANDMWQNVPVGTIDSTDPVTFYGAWNKLLSYYSQNFPHAKLGVVVSFWITEEYANAVKAVAKKYGVPYLNLYDDDKLPVTVGSRRPDVSDAVKTYRNAQWVVSGTNNHPSAEYHEIESYFIENWLRSL